MLLLVIGGSGSGKSAYAEKRVRTLADQSGTDQVCKYYLATMAVHDDEMRRKVARHQEIRRNDGWITLEYPTDVGQAAEEIRVRNAAGICEQEEDAGDGDNRRLAEGQNRRRSFLLLEDLGNLTANEMFHDGEARTAESVCSRIDTEIRQLERATSAVVVVSNSVFGDGCTYDAGTQNYIHALGMLHQRLAARANAVTEVVLGIPVELLHKCYSMNIK